MPRQRWRKTSTSSARGRGRTSAGGACGGAVYKFNRIQLTCSACKRRLVSNLEPEIRDFLDSQAFAFIWVILLCRYPAARRRGVAAEEGGAAGVQAEVRLYKLNKVDSKLESAWFQPLKLKYDFLVSKFALKLNVYRYTEPQRPPVDRRAAGRPVGGAVQAELS
jgi:hypothetical protein